MPLELRQPLECTTTTTGGPVASTLASASVSPLVSQHPSYPSSQQDTAKPLRRKLQKTRNNLRIGKRGSHDSACSTAARSSHSSATRTPLECETSPPRPLVTVTTHSHPDKSHISCERRPEPSPCIPMPTDLSDSKWLEYIEHSGLMNSPDLQLGSGLGSGSPNKINPEPPTTTTSLLPDLADRSLSRSRSQSASSKASFKNLKSMSLLSPPSKPRKSISKRSLVAPGFKIGQLDGSQPRKKEIRVVKRKASVELIAEQYQAFLESRDAEEEDESGDEGHHEEDTLKPREPSTILLEPTRFDPSSHPSSSPHLQQASLGRSRETVLYAPGPAEPNTISPGSDGTLVAFEEDAIYFKPVSFSDSPPPSPPLERSSFERRSFDKPLPKPPSSSDGSTPLQKSISMLVKELSTAMPPQTPANNTQGLQISIMIDAYERLRDQLDTSNMGEAEARSMRLMFDGWLAALHTMHRTMARSSLNERQTEELAEPVD